MRRTAQATGKQSAPEVVKLARRMTVLFRDRLEEQLRPLEVTAAQLQLLAALRHGPGSSGAQIARWCQVTPQTTHALLAAAEKRGWVRRSPHPENDHTLLASLTPEGLRVYRRGKAIAQRLQRRMLGTLTAAEVGRLQATLTELIATLESC